MTEENSSEMNKDQTSHNQSSRDILIRYIPLLLIFLLIASWLGYLISPLSQVDKIDVKGNDALVTQTILDESPVKVGSSIPEILFNKKKNEKKLTSAHPMIKSAKINIQNYNDIVLKIKEYQTVAYLSSENGYHRVLETGDILTEIEKHSHGNYPIISNFEESEELDLLINELEQLDKPLLTLISEIELDQSQKNSKLVTVYMNSGNIVKASIPNFAKKMHYFPQMVEAVDNQKGLFDLEIGAYFTPFADLEADQWSDQQILGDEQVDLSEELPADELEEFSTESDEPQV